MSTRGFTVGLGLLIGAVLLSCPGVAQSPAPESETGIAAYYSNVFQGRRTASGERYDKNALTAAHPSHPFGTRLRVTNLSNNNSVVVRVNDRYSPKGGRIIDLSRRAAEELGFLRAGLTRVKLEVVGPDEP